MSNNKPAEQNTGSGSPVNVDKDSNPSKVEKKSLIPNSDQERRNRKK